MKFGEYIEKLRVSRKISQKELADRVGYTREYINKMVAGKFKPTVKLLKALSKALNKDFHRLCQVAGVIPDTVAKRWKSSVEFRDFLITAMMHDMSGSDWHELKKLILKTKGKVKE